MRRHKQTSSSLSGVRTVSTPSLLVFLPSSPNEFFLGWGAGGRQISQNCGEGTHDTCAALPTSARWFSRILHQKLHLKSSSHKRQSLNMNFLGEILFDHPAHSPAHSHSMRHSPTSRRIMVKVKSRNLCRRSFARNERLPPFCRNSPPSYLVGKFSLQNFKLFLRNSGNHNLLRLLRVLVMHQTRGLFSASSW